MTRVNEDGLWRIGRKRRKKKVGGFLREGERGRYRDSES